MKSFMEFMLIIEEFCNLLCDPKGLTHVIVPNQGINKMTRKIFEDNFYSRGFFFLRKKKKINK